MVYPGVEGKGEWQISAHIPGKLVAGRCARGAGKEHRRIFLPADSGIDSSNPEPRDMGRNPLFGRSNLLETAFFYNPPSKRYGKRCRPLRGVIRGTEFFPMRSESCG